MERTKITEALNLVGQEVLIKGFISARRNLGKIIFWDVRDYSGTIQVVCVPQELPAEDLEKITDSRAEWAVAVTGMVNARTGKQANLEQPMGTVEVLAKGIEILAKSEPLPLDLEDENMGLDIHLDYLPLTLRQEKWRALFKIQTEIVEGFREYLRGEGFTEFQAPKLVGGSTEGGANVFKVDYFGHTAFLGQSPQFYKQIMVGIFERVFTVGNVYRAEEHATSRHVNEYTSLDLEMGMIKDHTDIITLETNLFRHILDRVDRTVPYELKLWQYVRPLLPENIPVLKLRAVQQLIKEGTGVDHTNEPDLEPNEEKWIGNYVKEKFNSDFVAVSHYPTVKRPMYTYPDEADPEFTKSFDMLFRGMEITTGGQRHNDYEKLVDNIKKWGLNPDNYTFYLEAFKYGMPPEGGLAIGLERLTARLLGIDNVKYATLFPRDLNRIDLQLSK